MISNKLKVLVCGAVQAYAGYAEHARTILRALRRIEDKIDLYLMQYGWAMSSNTYDNEDELLWFENLKAKFNPSMLGHFDISVQVGVPSEWQNYAKYNIGVTAGVEATSIPLTWTEPCKNVQKIITISNFSKQGFVAANVQTQIDVIEYPVKYLAPISDENKKSIEELISTPFNFIHVGQWAPRKNIERMITWFVEEFKNNENVGLILKLQSKSNSTPDRYECKRRLYDLLVKYPDRKCKVYLFHGDMSDQEIRHLITMPQSKAFISTTHGEGWGLGMFEAAYCGLPVVCTDYSGLKEYLYADKPDKNGKKKLRPFFQRVNFDLKPLEQHHFIPNILVPGMFWAYPKESDFKRKLQEVYKDYGRFKKQAVELASWIQEKFSFDVITKKYQDSIFEKFNLNEKSKNIDIVEVE